MWSFLIFDRNGDKIETILPFIAHCASRTHSFFKRKVTQHQTNYNLNINITDARSKTSNRKMKKSTKQTLRAIIIAAMSLLFFICCWSSFQQTTNSNGRKKITNTYKPCEIVEKEQQTQPQYRMVTLTFFYLKKLTCIKRTAIRNKWLECLIWHH